MVKEQLRGRDIDDPRVLDAMSLVPRHVFVLPEHRSLAYADGPLPIGANQTISQPYIVALMTQLLELRGDETVLEVGTGSGYQAAVLAYLARRVHTIERHDSLARLAARILADLGLDNVTVHVGDGSRGLPEFAPYQAILVTAAAPQVPPALFDQLDEAGRLVIPVGGQRGQTLERWLRKGEDFIYEPISPVAFVPLLGDFGWQDHD
ncbi:MAG TPA: protein-L-isoaspartate(D-aspartate) O-methyltransferase [Anaerolineales bacterium]